MRARDCDPKSSLGDFVAVSEPVDASLAAVLSKVVSDGIVAPGFEAGALEVLAAKKGGRYMVFEARTDYEPPEWEYRDVFGLRLAHEARRLAITAEVVAGDTLVPLPDNA